MGEVFDLIRDFVTIETSIGIGLIVSLVGAGLALIGGLMSLGGARAVPSIPGMPMPTIDATGGFGSQMPPRAQPPSDQPAGEGPEAPGS